MIDLEPLIKQGFFAILLVAELGFIIGIIYCIFYALVICYKELRYLVTGRPYHEHAKQFLK